MNRNHAQISFFFTSSYNRGSNVNKPYDQNFGKVGLFSALVYYWIIYHIIICVYWHFHLVHKLVQNLTIGVE